MLTVRRTLVVLGTAFSLVVWASAAWAAGGALSLSFSEPGGLDSSFSGDGKVATDITTGNDGAGGLAVQPDGKIVAGGWAGGNGGQFALIRYNDNGSLDTTFSGDGKLATNFTTGDDYAVDLALQSDGKIVAVGQAAGSGGRIAVARYNPNGSLDSSFSGDGKLLLNITTGFDAVGGVAVQSDGKLVMAGVTTGAGGQFLVVRLTTSGSLDTTFSGDGKLATNFSTGFDGANELALQANGKIVAAGFSHDGNRFAAARYNTNGSLDTTFAGDGRQTTDFGSGADVGTSIAVQADQKIVVVGWIADGYKFGFVRYNTSGSRDTTFSGDGRVTAALTGHDDAAYDLAIQEDGKIVAVGFADAPDVQWGIVRLTTDGEPDWSFGASGRNATNFSPGFDVAFRVALDPMGRIVVAGFVSGGRGRFGVARYQS
jgi:uncharacterized delta-60 repeat protein